MPQPDQLHGNAVATIVVARWEGGLDTDKLEAALSTSQEALIEELTPVLPVAAD